MREIFLLLKKDVTKFFWFTQNFSDATKSKVMRRRLIYSAIFIFSMSFSLYSVFLMMGAMYRNAAQIGAEEVFFGALALSFTMLLIITVAPYAISKLYYGKGITSLLTLPLNPKNIVTSGIYYISFSFVLYALLLALPAMIEHRRLNSLSFLYYPLGFFSLFIYSVIISSIICFAVILLMRMISKFPKAKSVLQMLGMMLMLLFIVIIQLKAPELLGNTVNTNSDFIVGMEETAKNLNIFMPFKFLAESLGRKDLASMLLPLTYNIIIALLLSNLIGIISSKLWIKGLNNIGQGKKSKAKRATLSENKLYKEKNIVIQIAKKDFKNILSSPVYIFNILLSSILVPIVIGIVNYVQFNNRFDVISMMNEGIYDKYITKLGISEINLMAIALVMGLVVGAVTSLYGSSASSTVTREGKSVWLSQVLPIREEQQVYGRTLCAFSIMMMGNTFLIALISVFLRVPLHIFLIGIVGSVFSSLSLISFSLFMDIAHPKLKWDTPQEAVKQNFNIFIAVFLDMAYIALHIFAIYKLIKNNIINLQNAFIPTIVLCLIQIIIFIIFTRLNIRTLKIKLPNYSA